MHEQVTFRKVRPETVLFGPDVAAGRRWVWAVFRGEEFILAARTKEEARRRYSVIELHSTDWWKKTGEGRRAGGGG